MDDTQQVSTTLLIVSEHPYSFAVCRQTDSETDRIKRIHLHRSLTSSSFIPLYYYYYLFTSSSHTTTNEKIMCVAYACLTHSTCCRTINCDHKQLLQDPFEYAYTNVIAVALSSSLNLGFIWHQWQHLQGFGLARPTAKRKQGRPSLQLLSSKTIWQERQLARYCPLWL